MNTPRSKWEALPVGRSRRSRANAGKEGEAVNTAGPLTKPRGEESLVVAEEAEEEEDGRRTVGLCRAVSVLGIRMLQCHRWPGLYLTDIHVGGCLHLSLSLTLGAKISWDKGVLRGFRYSMNSETVGIPPPPESLPSQQLLQPEPLILTLSHIYTLMARLLFGMCYVPLGTEAEAIFYIPHILECAPHSWAGLSGRRGQQGRTLASPEPPKLPLSPMGKGLEEGTKVHRRPLPFNLGQPT